MADARPFHWEYRPEPVAREVFRVEGGRPLNGTVRDQRRQERRAQADGRRDPDRRALPLHERPRDRGRARHGRDAARPRRRRRPPGARTSTRSPSGDVDWLFVPLEAAAKMRASFILLGPLLARFGRVIISNPGGDRIGRRPVNLHVDAMRALGAEIDYRYGYYFAQAPGRLRGAEVTLPVRDASWAPRTRCSPRRSPRATRSSGRRPRSPRSTTSSRSSRRWAPRSSGPTPTRSRSRAGAGCAAPSTRSCPTGSRPARSSSPAP